MSHPVNPQRYKCKRKVLDAFERLLLSCERLECLSVNDASQLFRQNACADGSPHAASLVPAVCPALRFLHTGTDRYMRLGPMDGQRCAALLAHCAGLRLFAYFPREVPDVEQFGEELRQKLFRFWREYQKMQNCLLSYCIK